MRYRTKLLLAALIAPPLTILFLFLHYLAPYRPIFEFQKRRGLVGERVETIHWRQWYLLPCVAWKVQGPPPYSHHLSCSPGDFLSRHWVVGPIGIAEENNNSFNREDVYVAQNKLDNAVLNTVLQDLLTYDGEGSWLLGDVRIIASRVRHPDISHQDMLKMQGNRPPAYLSFDRRSTYEPMDDREEEFNSSQSGTSSQEKLSPAQMTQVRIALQYMQQRIIDKSGVKNFHVTDPERILLPEPPNPASLQNFSLRASPPGYASGGNIAVVRLHIPVYLSGEAEAIFLLARQNGKWVVQQRKFY